MQLFESDPASYGELEGVYDYGGGYTTTIFVEEGRLYAQLTRGAAVEIFFEGPDRVFSLEGVVYTFTRTAETVSGLSADLGGGTTLRAKKQ